MTKTMTPDDARAAILARTAPEGLTVGGSLDLSGCTGLTALPEVEARNATAIRKRGEGQP